MLWLPFSAGWSKSSMAWLAWRIKSMGPLSSTEFVSMSLLTCKLLPVNMSLSQTIIESLRTTRIGICWNTGRCDMGTSGRALPLTSSGRLSLAVLSAAWK